MTCNPVSARSSTSASGERREKEERPGKFAITLRDIFGDLIIGTTGNSIDGICFGLTYYVTGIPYRNSANGKLYLEISSWAEKYPLVPAPAPAPPAYRLLWIFAGLVAVLLLALLGALYFVRRRILVPPPPPLPPPIASPVPPKEGPWGSAEVLTGPDQGKAFALHGEQILIGRQLVADDALNLVLDSHVSRKHGVINRKDGTPYFCDTDSTCGSWVNERKAVAGQEMPLTHGALLRLGPHTVIKFMLANASDIDDEVSMETRPFTETGDNWDEAPTVVNERGGTV